MTLATRAVLALCFGAALVACSGPKTEGQKKMSQLSEQMQRLDMALQSSKAEVQKTIEAHDMLVANADADLRERSAQRLEQTKARLEQVQAQVATTKTAFEPLMQTLHDHLIYLSNDLTIDSVASLSKDSGKLRSDVGPLYTALDQSTQPVRECARALSTSPQG